MWGLFLCNPVKYTVEFLLFGKNKARSINSKCDQFNYRRGQNFDFCQK